jgi:acetyl-CoA carboxylase beta subunit
MLKKEFKRKDVQRARNLITGKTGASTGTQIGYNKKTEDYKEGDIWTEGRKTWTIKNGIKQTVSKLDVVKKEVHIPLCCPNCGKVKYIKELELKNKLTSLDKIEDMLLDIANTSNSGFVSEDGVIEKWVGGIDAKKYTKDIKKYADKTRKKLEKELNDNGGTKGTN